MHPSLVSQVLDFYWILQYGQVLCLQNFHFRYSDHWGMYLGATKQFNEPVANHLPVSCSLKNMSCLVGKPTMWFPNSSDTNRPVQAQKQARSLKFWIYVEEELYYPRSENKRADQLRSYGEADLCLCFRLCRLLFFSMRWLIF